MANLLSISELLLIAPVAVLTLVIATAGGFVGYKSRDREVRILTELANRGKRMNGRDIDPD